MRIEITIADRNAPRGKMADAALVFDERNDPAEFQGLRLEGFTVWERTRGDAGFNVTFPARRYTTRSNEARTYAILRPIDHSDQTARTALSDLIVGAYEQETRRPQGRDNGRPAARDDDRGSRGNGRGDYRR